jgi:hypothetical protein
MDHSFLKQKTPGTTTACFDTVNDKDVFYSQTTALSRRNRNGTPLDENFLTAAWVTGGQQNPEHRKENVLDS